MSSTWNTVSVQKDSSWLGCELFDGISEYLIIDNLANFKSFSLYWT